MNFNEISEGLRDAKDNPCWKGYKPVGTKKKAGRTVPNCVPVKEDVNPQDVIKLDVPLFIRLLEYAREDAKTDMDLHNVTDKIIELASSGQVLDMAAYNNIMGQQIDEAKEKDPESEFFMKNLRAKYPQAKTDAEAMTLDYQSSQKADRQDISRLDQENDSEEADIDHLEKENDQEQAEIARLKQMLARM